MWECSDTVLNIEDLSQSSDFSILNTRGVPPVTPHGRKTRVDKGVVRGSRVSVRNFGKRETKAKNRNITLEDVRHMKEELLTTAASEQEYYREARRLAALKSRILRQERLKVDSEQIQMLRDALALELALKDKLIAACMAAVRCLEEHCSDREHVDRITGMLGDVFDASAAQQGESEAALTSCQPCL